MIRGFLARDRFLGARCFRRSRANRGGLGANVERPGFNLIESHLPNIVGRQLLRRNRYVHSVGVDVRCENAADVNDGEPRVPFPGRDPDAVGAAHAVDEGVEVQGFRMVPG